MCIPSLFACLVFNFLTILLLAYEVLCLTVAWRLVGRAGLSYFRPTTCPARSWFVVSFWGVRFPIYYN